MVRPLLLLDVDGVLALKAAAPEFHAQRVVSSAGENHDLWFNRDHGRWLRMLSQVFEVMWVTGWEHDAPRILGPMLGISEFDVLEFAQRPQIGVRLSKLPDVMALVGERPVAWIDDDLDLAATTWADRRAAPTLLVEPSPSVGLTATEVSRLLLFGGSLGLAVHQRAGVLLVDGARVAVIERRRDGATYFVLPGGGVEPGETIAEGAEREALEEAGVEVKVTGAVAHVQFADGGEVSLQHYFAADIVGGVFGPGSGPEYSGAGTAMGARGSYRPVWLPIDEVPQLDVRPRDVFTALASEGVEQLLLSPALVEEDRSGVQSR